MSYTPSRLQISRVACRLLSPISKDHHNMKEIESLEELYAGDSSSSDICDTLSDSESYRPSDQSDDSDSEY